MADLDLSEFMKEGSGGLTDLSWLDVNEADYHKLERLPEQNMDVVPELKALWNHEDRSAATHLIPNTGGPRAVTTYSTTETSEVVRVARLAVMQTTDASKIQDTLLSRFDRTTLSMGRTALASVFAERGLLGRFYIASTDFPNCAKGGSKDGEFVRRFANESRFVVAKTACGGCSHRQVLVGGSSHCGVFHKQIVMEVPYTEALAVEVEKSQIARGKAVQASTSSPRERIQGAYLAKSANTSPGFTGQTQAVQKPIDSTNVEQNLIAVASLMKKRNEGEQARVASEKARPIVSFLKREMLKGYGPEELIRSLRLAFDLRDLQATKAEWEPSFREVGLFGAVYSTQEAFADCREGSDFLAKHASKVRAIVSGNKCGSCVYAQASRCMMYGRRLVREASEVLTPETVSSVIEEHKIAGRLPFDAARVQWGATPVAALKAIHKTASKPQHTAAQQGVRGSIEKAFYGTSYQPSMANDLTLRNIVKVAREFLNEGLYGQDLGDALKVRFEVRDLVAATAALKPVLAEQGLQGIKYIDPTVYDDYGAGCKEASRKHRSRGGVKYAKVGSKCGTCVHHTRPGFCSVLSKELVVEPPYIDKLAEQRAMLASGRSTEVSYASLANNGLTMMQEYELQNGDGTIDLLGERAVVGASDFEFGATTFKL